MTEDRQAHRRTGVEQVLAILVSHRGSRWLPQTLAALDELQRRPDHLVLVHDDTDAATRELLTAHAGADRVVVSPQRSGFGAQVAHALESETQAYDWIWLLHDDAICAPDSLAALLDAAGAADDIGIVGPKLREWPSLKRLLEVGVTMTGTGQRETGLESGEPDAGQHDRPRDVLAVSSAGMLVRRGVWEALGGMDPALPLFYDDIDLGWRANRAGYRVRTAPRAVLFHAEATRNRRRVRRGGVTEHAGDRRAAALYTMLANTDRSRFVPVSARLVVGSLLRLLGFLAGKDLRSARGDCSRWSRCSVIPAACGGRGGPDVRPRGVPVETWPISSRRSGPRTSTDSTSPARPCRRSSGRRRSSRWACGHSDRATRTTSTWCSPSRRRGGGGTRGSRRSRRWCWPR